MKEQDLLSRIKLESSMEYTRWVQEIPFIDFPTDWNVKIIPPYGGAVVRFLIEKDSNRISVYLDCYDQLGCYGSPYWEVYPHFEDVFRCDMNDTDSLLKAITESLKNKETL